MKIGRYVLLHWHRYRDLPVTLHLRRDHRFSWTGIYGAQIGPWFIGAIRGTAAPQPVQE